MCRYDCFPCAAFREHKRLTGRPYLFPTPGGVRERAVIGDRTRAVPSKLARFLSFPFYGPGVDEVTACDLRGLHDTIAAVAILTRPTLGDPFHPPTHRLPCNRLPGTRPFPMAMATQCLKVRTMVLPSLLVFRFRGMPLGFATMTEGARIRYVKPGRKAGTDRRNTVGTTVPERIPEGRIGQSAYAQVPPGETLADRHERSRSERKGIPPRPSLRSQAAMVSCGFTLAEAGVTRPALRPDPALTLTFRLCYQ